ncbi:hypothetical protein DXA13_05560 [Clostridium sp. AM58-1XD]|nr:hypothetical protein DXA13_05560 [Clostridium sp. AM58-1XD]
MGGIYRLLFSTRRAVKKKVELPDANILPKKGKWKLLDFNSLLLIVGDFSYILFKQISICKGGITIGL